MYETVKYLTGKLREPRLHQVVVTLAKAMLLNSKIASDDMDAQTKVDNALTSGKAAEIFGKMISALGGPSDLLDNPWRSMNKAEYIIEILAPRHGYIEAMQTRAIGYSVVGLGGGRISNDQKIDHSVGFDRILPIGTRVNRADVLARVHANSLESAEHASKQYINSISFSDEPLNEPQVIY